MKPISIIAFFIGILSINAQDTRKFNLKEALEFTAQNNLSYKNAQLDVSIAKETVKQTASYGLPQVNATAGYQQYLQIPGNWTKNFNPSAGAPEYIFLRFQQEFFSTASLSVSQLIFDGSYLVGIGATKAFLEMNELLQSKSLKDAQLIVAKAYVTAVTTQKNLDLINSNIALLEKSSFDVTELNKEGFVENLDVDRLTLTLNNLKLQRERLQNAIGITLNALKMQMGLEMGIQIELTDNLESLEKNLLVNDANMNELNISNRIEHRILEQSIALGKLDQKRYKATSLPSVAGFYQTQRSTQRSSFNFFKGNLPINNQWVPAQYYGLNLRVPIFAGGLTRSKINECNIKIQKAQNDMANFDRFAQFEYNNAKNSYALNLKQASNQKENLALAQKIYEKATLKYSEGVGSTLEMMQAQTDLRTANNNYMNAIYDLVISKIDIQNTTGTKIQ